MIKITPNLTLLESHCKDMELFLNSKISNLLKNNAILYKKASGTYKKGDTRYSLEPSQRNIIISIQSKLNDILSGNSNILLSIINEFGSQKDNKILEHIFVKQGYESFFGGKHAYSFVSALNLKTCPYCNRNYTFVVDSENGKLRPEIDHFYPKSEYPYLAMSFYNLIPSCQVCNHTKGEKLIDKNPYTITDKDFKFTWTPRNTDFTIIESQEAKYQSQEEGINSQKYQYDSFDIDFTSEKNENIKVLKLEELYKQHKDIVLELLIKRMCYPESYIESLTKFNFSKDEIYRYIIGNYVKDKDLHKRPLSKLTKDIAKELGLYDKLPDQ